MQSIFLESANLVFLFVFNTKPTVAGFYEKVNVSCSVVSDSLPPHGLWPSILHPWDSPGKNTGVGCLSLLQGIFLTQGSNLSLLHCRQFLYRLSPGRSPGKEMAIHFSILAWEIPWTEEPCRLQSIESQKSWRQLSN